MHTPLPPCYAASRDRGRYGPRTARRTSPSSAPAVPPGPTLDADGWRGERGHGSCLAVSALKTEPASSAMGRRVSGRPRAELDAEFEVAGGLTRRPSRWGRSPAPPHSERTRIRHRMRLGSSPGSMSCSDSPGRWHSTASIPVSTRRGSAPCTTSADERLRSGTRRTSSSGVVQSSPLSSGRCSVGGWLPDQDGFMATAAGHAMLGLTLAPSRGASSPNSSWEDRGR
jgi:hypothetical protein